MEKERMPAAEMFPDDQQGAEDVTFNGDPGNAQAVGDLFMTEPFHPAQGKDFFQLFRQSADSLIQRSFQLFELQAVLGIGGGFPEITSEVGLVFGRQYFFTQVIPEQVPGNGIEKSFEIMDLSKFLAVDPEACEDFLGKVFSHGRILGEFEREHIHVL